MNEAEFKARTKEFALRVLELVDALPWRRSADVLGDQLALSGTSVGANYRAVCRALSGRPAGRVIFDFGLPIFDWRKTP